jgi:uncharacterized protein (UPF0548 family)
MFLLREPTTEKIRRFIASQQELPFSYAEVGATRAAIPGGYKLDHNRVRLGEGAESYKRAVAALRGWKHFDLGWVRIVPPEIPLEVGTTVAVLAHTGLWSLNACRVVYVIDEERKFAFAYGTLPDHVERGEERFTIEWRPNDDSVWYDILAFSRPKHFLAQAGYPFTRWLQKRFARDSLRAMKMIIEA